MLSLCEALFSKIINCDEFFLETENFIITLHTWTEIILNFRPEIIQDDDNPPHFSGSAFIAI
jgi:hypothetical protein